jgi:hypothetical protein
MNTIHTLAALTRQWWSQTTITFNQADLLDRVPHLGRYPLMVSPIMGTMRLSKVLMDRASGLNILYASTLNRMKIPRSSLCPIQVSFYGIIPGKEVVPLKRIRLNVTFS